MFPDSPAAVRFRSKRTKTKECIFMLKVKLQAGYFSIIIDETTNISATKELAVVCRYYNKEKQNIISQFYDMIPTASGTAESIYKSIVTMFNKDDVPMSNIVGFAADTTNSMFGQHNSVASRLKSA